MRGHAQAHAVLPTGHGIQDMRLAFQDHGQRTGPEGLSHASRSIGYLQRPLIERPQHWRYARSNGASRASFKVKMRAPPQVHRIRTKP